MLKALFMDFDGLMLDTETACYAGWRMVFEKHGFDYPLEAFQPIVGTNRSPRSQLEEKVGNPLDWQKIDAERRAYEQAFGEGMEIKPGVLELLDECRDLGWRCAVVSSSPVHWVHGHLEKRDALDYFEELVCLGDAPRAKPAPDLYLEALRRFGLEGPDTVAFEDSYNGSLAAKRAGLWCVAVPNEITRGMDFSHADLVVDSLEKVGLSGLLNNVMECK